MNIITFNYLVLSLNHIVYNLILNNRYLVLYYTTKYKKDPCILLHYFCVSVKVVQAIVAVYIYYLYECKINYNAIKVQYLTIFTDILYILFGQYLNYCVYKELGIDGVYYGNIFNKKVMFSNNYPFNIKCIKYHQYLGCVVTYIGILNILKIVIINDIIVNHILNVKIFITLAYLFTIYTETDLINKIILVKK